MKGRAKQDSLQVDRARQRKQRESANFKGARVLRGSDWVDFVNQLNSEKLARKEGAA